jgi:hypothetical protein
MPWVSPRNRGANPGGSTVTSKVVKALIIVSDMAMVSISPLRALIKPKPWWACKAEAQDIEENAFPQPQKPVYNRARNWRSRACSAINSAVIPNRDRDLI